MENELPYSTELLKALHILTVDGKLNQDSRRKLKQVQHLCQFMQPMLQNVSTDFSLIDMGAGKSYLGFLLYDQFLKQQKQGKIFGIESRQELINQSVQLAHKLKFERMKFINSTIEDAISNKELPSKVSMVTALHACDTATDQAIHFALTHHATNLVLVPCCQAEVAAHLKTHKAKMLKSPLTEIWRHSLHTREFGSHLTNVLRCLLLEAKGYQVTITELVGWEHSMKNELIIAKFIDQPNLNSKNHLESLLQEFNLIELKSKFCY